MSGDPYFGSVVLLCGFNGADAATSTTDEATAKAITFNGNAQLDTAQQKFGTASLLLDGSGDYLSLADASAWAFSGDFTIELFVRYNSVTDAEFISQWTTSGTTAGFMFGRTAAGGLEFIFYNAASALQTVARSWTPSASTWYHVCVDRSGNDFRLYVDGVMLGAKTTNSAIPRDAAQPLNIGRINHTTPRYLNGWLDEIRITNGVARYASDAGFTAPTAEFPRTGPPVVTDARITQVALEQWASVATAATGRAKVWSGSAWALKPVKVWSGSAWVEKPLKVWNGSAWV